MMPWIDSGKSSASPTSVHPPSPLDQQAAVLQHPHVLLRIQRVALRAAKQRLLYLGGQQTPDRAVPRPGARCPRRRAG